MFQWEYMINFDENEDQNGKTDHIKKPKIDLEVVVETNIQNIACLCKTMSRERERERERESWKQCWKKLID